MTQKILGYVMAKNEWPMLGLSILHALRVGCEHVVVVNHQSTDGTKDGLERLKHALPDRLTVIELNHDQFLQEATTKVILSGFGGDLYDWVYVFDADEFLLIEGGQSLPAVLQDMPADVDVVRYQVDQWVAPHDMDNMDVDQFTRIKQRAQPCSFLQQTGESLAEQLITGNINYFDVEFPSKVIVRGRFAHKIFAGAHLIKSDTGLTEEKTHNLIMRCAHLPLLNKTCLVKKSLHGKALVDAGFSRLHGWQNQALYQIELAGQLDDYWQRHSVSESAQLNKLAGYPTLIEDNALVTVLDEAIKAYKKLFTSDSDTTNIQKLPEASQLSLERLIDKVWVADNKFNKLISHLNQAVTERDGQIANLNQAVTERDGQIQNLTNKIDEICSSTSWRVSAPVRWVGWCTRRIINLFKLPAILLKRGGGLKNTFKKALELHRREGIPGIRRGLAWVANAGAVSPILGSDGHDRNDYTEWVRRYDTLTDESRSKMRKLQSEFAMQPLISVVMPTYNPKPEWLIEAIDSVRNQIYPHWELCIADDASTNPTVHKILTDYQAKDARIKVVFREQNGHISAASNSALEIATGEWIALLDHDDVLAEHALFWVVETINRHPDAGLIYSDEDKITETGERLGPYFKCDWNPDLFYSHNMISHLGVYKSSLIREIRGFRQGLEGSQDYDLALRCIERLQPGQIVHIARVLYHWRVHPESTAMTADSKPYAMLAGERAINEHFVRTGVHGKVTYVGHGYQPTYDLPDPLPRVSIIIPTCNDLQLLRQCIDSIFKKTTYKNYEIIVVDNGSDDSATLVYLDELSQHPKVRVIRDDGPFNYSRLNNKAVELAEGEFIALLNNDIEVISPEWLSVMVAHALRPEIGAVGAKLYYTNKTLQHGGIILGIRGFGGHSHKHSKFGSLGYMGRLSLTQNLSAVTGACLVIRKEIFNRLGGLDEQNLAVAFNDVDFCLRAQQHGYRNIWTPQAELIRHESATRGYEDIPEKQARFAKEGEYMKQRWGDQFLNDPAYSPNLTLYYEDFSYAWPPRVESISKSLAL